MWQARPRLALLLSLLLLGALRAQHDSPLSPVAEDDQPKSPTRSSPSTSKSVDTKKDASGKKGRRSDPAEQPASARGEDFDQNSSQGDQQARTQSQDSLRAASQGRDQSSQQVRSEAVNHDHNHSNDLDPTHNHDLDEDDFSHKHFGPDGQPVGKAKDLSNAKDAKEAAVDKTQIELNTPHKIDKQTMTFTVPENIGSNEIYVLQLTGIGSVQVEVYGSHNTEIPTNSARIVLDTFTKPSYVPFDEASLGRKGTMLALKIHDHELPQLWTFKLVRVENLEMEFNENIRIFSYFAEIVHVKVTATELNSVAKEKENRLQFILQTSLENQYLSGAEKVEMFINRDATFPTAGDYQIKASGNLGTGLIKTLSKGNQFYCVGGSCAYYVTLHLQAIEHVNFFPTIFANNSTLKFNHYLSLMEELEPGEHIQYDLDMPVSEGSWVFSLTPYEGAVELFINPDSRPSDLDHYKYQASSHHPEEIIITDYEIKKFGFKTGKFFVSYRSLDPSHATTFRFEVRRLPITDRKMIKENYAESGVAAIGEIINYYIDFGHKAADTIAVDFKLESFAGVADLYVKECLPGETDCKVTEADLNKSESSPKSGRIFRFSKLEHKGEDKKNDYIMLHFNCVPEGTLESSVNVNDHENSQSCLFAVGVHCQKAGNKYGAFYKLVAYGQSLEQQLTIRDSATVKAAARENMRYVMNVGATERTDGKWIDFHVVAITGVCKVYFSQTNENPTASDYDTMIDVRNESLVSLHTAAYKTTMALKKGRKNASNAKNKFVYISIDASEYTILNLYADLKDEANHQGDLEVLKDFNLVHKKIPNHDYITNGAKNTRTYYKNFIYHVPDRSSQQYAQPKLKISLNSHVLGLKICVQDAKEFDKTAPCLFSSMNEHLTLDETDLKLPSGKTIIISIQKVLPADASTDHFPIEFSLDINSGISYAETELLTPGKSYSSKFVGGESSQFGIDLQPMKNHFSVFFTSDEANAQANVSIGEGDNFNYIATLDGKRFGFKVIDGQKFKRDHCKGASCKLAVSVYAFTMSPQRYSLTYVLDDMPIVMKEGDVITVPNNEETYFVAEADRSSALSFSAFSDTVSSVVYSKILPQKTVDNAKDLKRELSDMNFEFKTNIENNPQVIYPLHLLQQHDSALVGFLTQPKFGFHALQTSDEIAYYTHKDALIVHVHAKMLKLKPFYQMDGVVAKGDFSYFYFHIDEPMEFSVMLSLHGGEAEMYLDRTAEEFPTNKRYWKKGSGTRGDELVITQDMFTKPQEMVGSFVVGVRGVENAKFSLLFLPEFHNLIKVRYQRLNNIELKKGKKYFFDFFNTHENYSTMIYAAESDVEVSALNYDANLYQDFVTMVTDENNYVQKFVFKKGDLPRKRSFEDAVPLDSHVVVRMMALDRDTKLSFLVYDQKQPIEAPAETRFSFVQNKDETTTFRVKLDSNYDEVDFDVKLDFGDVSVMYSDINDSYDNSQKISTPSQKYFKYRVKKTEAVNDILIFEEFFIRVHSTEFSKFSIFVKPKDKFKQLKSSEPEIIYTDPENDLFLYYYLSPQRAKTITSLVFDISSVQHYIQKPTFLFVSDSEVVMDSSTPYLPMPLVDLIERENGDFRTTEVRPDVQPGNFVIKIEKYPAKLPIKIAISENNQRNIEINGMYRGSIPVNKPGSHVYTMFVPQAGEFRLLLESCSGVSIESAEFTSDNPTITNATNSDHNKYTYNEETRTTKIEFENRFLQAYPFISLNETFVKPRREFKTLSFPVKRGFVSDKGVLRFRVVPEESFVVGRHPAEHYVLNTEFRPLDKDLILKDYIQLHTDPEEFRRLVFAYEFFDNNKKLRVSAKMPKFKEQLMVDYPDLKVVSIKLYAYLLSDNTILSKIESCGLSALEGMTYVKRVVTRDVPRAQINQAVSEGDQDFVFWESDLSKFAGNQTLNMVSFVSVSFYDSEDEIYDVNLNYKFTNVPYFLLTIPNNYGAIFAVSHALGLILAIVAIFLLFVYFRVYRKSDSPAAEKPNNQYFRGNDSFSQPTRLEMSSVSRDDMN